MKKKNPRRWLLLIPIQIVIDIVLFWVAVWLDTAVLPDHSQLGHPAPAVTIFALMAIPVITIIVVIVSLILTSISSSRKGSNFEDERSKKEHDEEMQKVEYYLQYVLRPETPLEQCRKHFEDFSLEADEKIYYHIMGNGSFTQIASLLRAVIDEKKGGSR